MNRRISSVILILLSVVALVFPFIKTRRMKPLFRRSWSWIKRMKLDIVFGRALTNLWRKKIMRRLRLV
ncbi:hypothetical protein [Thermoflavimicrobium dichotomicum]|uniref:Uncharacterized protein n=1 Tax=Thermoflavimicrobium dichotomicum TaxID=46223 RepID=A0A1I3MWJ4_9BACL|nr:hypothetical protein [Thermoflavimicrobium dichotomicum]SFJ01321.1 hypothetical protein SAMN05421852_103232 [Thermoflavimicrobium dichotomicum]